MVKVGEMLDIERFEVKVVNIDVMDIIDVQETNRLKI